MIARPDITNALQQVKEAAPQIVVPSTVLVRPGLKVLQKLGSEVPFVGEAVEQAKDLTSQGVDLVVAGAEGLVAKGKEEIVEHLPQDQYQGLTQKFAQVRETVEGTMIAAQELNEIAVTPPLLPTLWKVTAPIREFGLEQIQSRPLLRGSAALLRKGAELLLPSAQNETIVKLAVREALGFVRDAFGSDAKGKEGIARYIRARQAMTQKMAGDPLDDLFVSAELSGIYDEILVEDAPVARRGEGVDTPEAEGSFVEGLDVVAENQSSNFFNYSQSLSKSRQGTVAGQSKSAESGVEGLVSQSVSGQETLTQAQIEAESGEAGLPENLVQTSATGQSETGAPVVQEEGEIVVENTAGAPEGVSAQAVEVVASSKVLDEDIPVYFTGEYDLALPMTRTVMSEEIFDEGSRLQNSSMTTETISVPSIAAEESLSFAREAIVFAEDHRLREEIVDSLFPAGLEGAGAAMRAGLITAFGFVKDIFGRGKTEDSYLVQLIQNQQPRQDPSELPQYGFVFIASGMYLIPAREKQAGIRDNVESKMTADAMHQKLYTVSDNETSQGGHNRDARETVVASVDGVENDVEIVEDEAEEEVYVSVPAADVVV